MIRAGFAGQETPPVIFPNIIARINRPEHIKKYGNDGKCYIGETVYKIRDAEKVYCRELPITNGDNQTLEDMEQIWEHIF